MKDVSARSLQPVFRSEIIRTAIPPYKGLCLADQQPAFSGKLERTTARSAGALHCRRITGAADARTPERTAPLPVSTITWPCATGIRSQDSLLRLRLMPCLMRVVLPLSHFSITTAAFPASELQRLRKADPEFIAADAASALVDTR